jgi:hypothetical protein
MYEIVIWGIGSKADKWLNENITLLKELSILAYVDSYCTTSNVVFRGVKVIHPSLIKTLKFDKLVIMSSFFDEIKEDAVEKYNIDADNIISEKELFQICFLDMYKDNLMYYWNLDDSDVIKQKFILSLLRDETLIVKYRLQADFLYLKKNYGENRKARSYVPATEDSNVLWVCWLQGLDEAPAIVQACVSSMKRHITDRKLILITSENYKDYISIPKDIEDMYHSGIISNTHFSDIIRFELLANHGGLWMDATVFCTGNIPNAIYENEFFAYQFSPYTSAMGSDPRLISNWFLYAKKHCVLVEDTLDVLYSVWRKEKRMINYFMFHLVFHFVTEIYPELWSQVPYYTNCASPLCTYLNQAYDEKTFQRITTLSPIHKLSYKVKITPPSNVFTFYDFIISTIQH